MNKGKTYHSSELQENLPEQLREYSDLIEDARAMYADDKDFDVDAEWNRFQQEHAALLNPSRAHQRKTLWWLAVAAAAILIAFIVIAPQVRESRDMARYEGSYVEEDGQRVDDYRLIKGDIREALSMADQAEAYLQEK